VEQAKPGEPTARTDDQAETGRQRYTVAEAAQLLDTSVEGIRGRIKRGTLENVKDGGTVYVLLSSDQAQPASDQSTDQARPDAREDLVDELRSRVAFLEHELERRGEETERLHRIIGGLTQATAQLSSRVPELEARREEPSESPEPRSSEASPTPTDAGGEVHEPSEPPDSEAPRSWWRRWLG